MTNKTEFMLKALIRSMDSMIIELGGNPLDFRTTLQVIESEALQPNIQAGYPSEIETLLHSALVDIARALERRCYRTATKKTKDALAKVPSCIFDV